MSDRREGFFFRIQVKDDQGTVVGEADAVSFKGLLALAHEDELLGIHSKLVQAPSPENQETAIVRATVRMRRGTFSATGDATPSNVSPLVAPHFIRCAETRAFARALRLALNVAEVAVEELAGNVHIERKTARTSLSPTTADADADEFPPPLARAELPSRTPGERFRGRDANPTEAQPSDRRAMSDEQRKLLFRLAFESGATRDNARERVLFALGVDRLEHATRVDASRAIDRLKREANGAGMNGRNGAAPHG